MSYLQELIQEAAGDRTPTAVLLRKIKVLAARVPIPNLESWVDNELNGYGDSADLPPYRGPFDAEAKGDFAGPFGSGLQNASIPPGALPNDLRPGVLFTLEFRQSVAELQDLASKARENESKLSVPWPSDAVIYVNYLIKQGTARLYPSMGLVRAWKPVSPSQVHGVLDTVRNRILDLALRIEAEDPGAGERAGSRLSTEHGNTIFNTTVYGGTPNIAVGSSRFIQQAISGAARSKDDLLSQLRQLEVPTDLVDDLEIALDEDAAESDVELQEPGPRVRDWLGRISVLGAKAGGKLGSSVTAGVVTQLILAHFGIGGHS